MIELKNDIKIEPLKCLRGDYLYNECSLCVDACPRDALSIKTKRVNIAHSICNGCAGCVGVCPTQAIGLSHIDKSTEILKFIGDKNSSLSCEDMKFCLSMIHVEEFISIGLRKDEMICDLSKCAKCEINKENKLLDTIEKNIEQSNDFLYFFEKSVKKTYEIKKQDRREIFRKFTQNLVKAQEEEVDFSEVYHVELPTHRQLFQNSLKSVVLDLQDTVIKGEFDFIKNKKIDFNTCTNCGDCVQFCPTNALSYSSDKMTVLFQDSKCIACHICDDICKPKSFSNEPSLDLVNVAFSRASKLIEHHLAVCSECKTPFSQKKDEKICGRCVDFTTNYSDIFKMASE
jgi:ferredoxin